MHKGWDPAKQRQRKATAETLALTPSSVHAALEFQWSWITDILSYPHYVHLWSSWVCSSPRSWGCFGGLCASGGCSPPSSGLPSTCPAVGCTNPSSGLIEGNACKAGLPGGCPGPLMCVFKYI